MLIPRRYLPWLRRALLLALVLVLGFAIHLTVHTVRARRLFEKTVAQIEAEGGILDCRAIAPQLERGEPNASLVLSAVELILSGTTGAGQGPSEDDIAAALLGDEEATARLQEALDPWRFRQVFSLLEGARNVERANFLVTAESRRLSDPSGLVSDGLRGPDILLTARGLRARAAVSSNEGDSAGAYADLDLVFRMARWTEQENPNLAQSILAGGIVSRGFDALEKILFAHPPIAEVRGKLLTELEGLELDGPIPGLRGDRAFHYQSMTGALRSGWPEHGGDLRSALSRFLEGEQIFEVMTSYLRVDSALLEVSKVPPFRRPDFLSPYGLRPDWLQLDVIGSPYPGYVIQRGHSEAQRRDLARLALAAAAFEEREGRPVTSLEELVPRDLPELPGDRFTGGPLKVARQPGLCLVYSVGWDFEDDGGQPREGPAPDAQGDLVWRIRCGSA
ncbi:MAG: hypothetical protein KDD47_25170 [Acidobacteria bacterium]|nr:hypothetical protein [Acidobacteriota bacterium]